MTLALIYSGDENISKTTTTKTTKKTTTATTTTTINPTWTGPFSTEASGTYQPALFKTITDGDTAVIFTVRASNDVHVGYFSELKTYGNGGGLYEIVIGGWRV